MAKYFIFIDESGTNTHDQYFGLGCMLVPVEKIGEYMEIIESQYQKILSHIKKKEFELEQTLSGENLINFYKGRKSGSYEMKFKHVNATTQEPYQRLISRYFTLSECKYCCLVIDKTKYSAPAHLDRFDVYINQLVMLVKNNTLPSDHYVILPDNITTPREKSYELSIMKKLGSACIGVHRIESHSSLFLQMVDVITGAILYDYKGGENTAKLAIVQKIQHKLGLSTLKGSSTKHDPNYFSIREYKKSG